MSETAHYKSPLRPRSARRMQYTRTRGRMFLPIVLGSFHGKRLCFWKHANTLARALRRNDGISVTTSPTSTPRTNTAVALSLSYSYSVYHTRAVSLSPCTTTTNFGSELPKVDTFIPMSHRLRLFFLHLCTKLFSFVQEGG